MSKNSSVILLVEDDSAHAELVKRGFKDHRIENTIFHVSDGEEALDYLFRRGTYEDPEKSPRPRVILLDLRMPKIDGLEVLKEVKGAHELSGLPVVILSTSAAEHDLARTSEYHANSYLVKPSDYDKFIQMIDMIGTYWLNMNILTDI